MKVRASGSSLAGDLGYRRKSGKRAEQIGEDEDMDHHQGWHVDDGDVVARAELDRIDVFFEG